MVSIRLLDNFCMIIILRNKELIMYLQCSENVFGPFNDFFQYLSHFNYSDNHTNVKITQE